MIILKRKKGTQAWLIVADFESDYYMECKKGSFSLNNFEYFKEELEEKKSIELLWADYKISPLT